MKFNCGPTSAEKWKAKKAAMAQWHPFFTILPCRVGPRDCRWLETIERRGEPWALGMYGGWWWEYRAK